MTNFIIKIIVLMLVHIIQKIYFMNFQNKIHGDIFKQMYTNPRGIQSDKFSRPTGNPSLISTNPIDLNELLIKALYVHNNSINILEKSKKIKVEAVDLDKILIQQYHLE